jgi:hypothetical protein
LEKVLCRCFRNEDPNSAKLGFPLALVAFLKSALSGSNLSAKRIGKELYKIVQKIRTPWDRNRGPDFHFLGHELCLGSPEIKAH